MRLFGHHCEVSFHRHSSEDKPRGSVATGVGTCCFQGSPPLTPQPAGLWSASPLPDPASLSHRSRRVRAHGWAHPARTGRRPRHRALSAPRHPGWLSTHARLHARPPARDRRAHPRTDRSVHTDRRGPRAPAHMGATTASRACDPTSSHHRVSRRALRPFRLPVVSPPEGELYAPVNTRAWQARS